MARSLYVRDVPEHLTGWIHRERERWLMKQREFVISVLEQAYNGGHTPTLFDEIGQQGDSPPAPSTERLPFLFADLFAGIGGLRLGLERVGGRCVFSSEWDKHCQKTYAA